MEGHIAKGGENIKILMKFKNCYKLQTVQMIWEQERGADGMPCMSARDNSITLRDPGFPVANGNHNNRICSVTLTNLFGSRCSH